MKKAHLLRTVFKKCFIMAMFLCCVFVRPVYAASVEINTGDVDSVKNSIIEMMMAKTNGTSLSSSDANSMVFTGMVEKGLETAHFKYNYTIYQSRQKIEVTLHTYVAGEGFLANFGYTEETSHGSEQLLIILKAINDGFYQYGFTNQRTTIKNVVAGSAFAKAGISAGQKVKTINGVKATTDGMMIIPLLPQVTLVMNNGNSYTVSGEYHTADEAREKYGI